MMTVTVHCIENPIFPFTLILLFVYATTIFQYNNTKNSHTRGLSREGVLDN